MKLLKRRIIPCLLAAAMVLGNAAPAVTHAEPAATVQSEETGTVSDFPFSSFKGEDLTDTGNGIRVSEYEGDHFAVTDTWAKYFSMEADVTVESGFNPLFLIGVKDRDNVSQAWFGMGINRDSTNDYNNDANSAKIRVFTVGDCGGSVDAFKKLDIEDPEELAMLLNITIR